MHLLVQNCTSTVLCTTIVSEYSRYSNTPSEQSLRTLLLVQCSYSNHGLTTHNTNNTVQDSKRNGRTNQVRTVSIVQYWKAPAIPCCSKDGTTVQYSGTVYSSIKQVYSSKTITVWVLLCTVNVTVYFFTPSDFGCRRRFQKKSTESCRLSQ